MSYKNLKDRRKRYAYIKTLTPEEQEHVRVEYHKRVAERKAYAPAVKECKLKRKCLRKELAWRRRSNRRKLWIKTEHGRAIRKAIKKRYNKKNPHIKNKSPSDRAIRAVIDTRKRALHKEMTDFDRFVYKEAYRLRILREKIFNFSWHIDHTIPISKGGTNAYDNIEVVPAIWNMDKSNKHSNRFWGISDDLP